jgi:hypothetical protein
MNWQEVLTILVPILGMMAWVYNRIEKKFDTGFTELKAEIKDLRKDIQSIDSRVSRIEGHLIGMHHWEPKVIEKKEEK